MISHDHRAIFVHCQKCAGESVEKLIMGKADKDVDGKPFKGSREKHYSAADYIDTYGDALWNDYFTFSIVRNPWDRLVSWVQYRNLRFRNGREVTTEQLKRESNFKFIRQASYTKMLFRDDKPLVDFVGRFENLEKDIQKIGSHLALGAASLPRTNTSKHKPYLQYYDLEAREIVADVFGDDIKHFSYRFGD